MPSHLLGVLQIILDLAIIALLLRLHIANQLSISVAQDIAKTAQAALAAMIENQAGLISAIRPDDVEFSKDRLPLREKDVGPD
jgi:competence protein ComGC